MPSDSRSTSTALPSSRFPGGSTRWRSVTTRSSLRTKTTISTRRSAMRRTNWRARARATSSCSSRASARSGRRRRPCANTTRLILRSCPCSRGSRPRSRSAYSSRTPAGALCSRPTSRRPRSPSRESVMSSTPVSPASSASYRNKVEQLRVESVSQASAKQRAGRCGRVASGICVRLYAEEEFKSRPAFTDPEVLRSSLANVILRMKSLGLGRVEEFPFIDPPASKAIQDGYALLAELGAVDEANELTEIGKQLARLPVDPRIGRMVLAAKSENALREVLIIAAGLSVQDPRQRPSERAAAADEAQKRFDDEKSDFLSWIKLWNFFEEALAHRGSGRKLHEACREHFLSFNRMQEWRDIHGQLKELVVELGWRISETPATYQQVHRALLAGLLGNV